MWSPLDTVGKPKNTANLPKVLGNYDGNWKFESNFKISSFGNFFRKIWWKVDKGVDKGAGYSYLDGDFKNKQS